jgi:SAM-dependent methyltransferase
MTEEHSRSYSNRHRAESFGTRPQAYDRARPDYPAALINDLVAERPAGGLDVGCGTGKAARLIVARGVPMLGVEIDERMAAVARSHGITVEIGSFETWADDGRRFDLMTCAQAWHWIDPAVGIPKAARVLAPGGRLALFWNFASFDPSTRSALDAVYRHVAPELSEHSVVRDGGPATVTDHLAELRHAEQFADLEHRRYPWTTTYSRGAWLDLVATHSDHATLPAEQLAELLAALGRAVDALGGSVHAEYTTDAIFARH